MIQFIFITGVVLIALLAYFLGNRLIGKKRKGGMRAIAFVFGGAVSLLGGLMIQDAPDNILPFIGGIVLLFGIYLTAMSFIASNKMINKITTHLGDGL